MRKLEYLRKQEQQQIRRQILQEQLTIDYINANSVLGRSNKDYALTEKVFTGTSEQLTQILSKDNNDKLEVNPNAFPEGLVLEDSWFKFIL